MKRILTLGLALVLTVGCFTGCAPKPEAAAPAAPAADEKVTLQALFMKQAGYSEEDVTKITEEFKTANPNMDVQLTFVAYEALEQKILTSAQSGGYDVVLIDAPWTAKFAKAGFVMDVTDRLAAADRENIFTGALDAVSYQDKLFGMPWLNDTRYLFYNKKMLKAAGFENPPATFQEMLDQARVLKSKGIVEYPIAASWAQAETLVCDFTSLTEAYGPGMIDKDGNPVLTSDSNIKALDFMVSSLKDGLANPSSTEFLEEDVRGVFSSGKAAFALNWTYMYNLAKDPAQSSVTEDVGIAPSPGTEYKKSASVNGGMGLSVTSGSKHPDQAWQYISYLSSQDVQKRFAKNALPIWKSLYTDPAVVETSPEVVAASVIQYEFLANRPRVPWYGELSLELQTQIQKAMLGEQSPKDALQNVQTKAEELVKK